MTDNEIPRNWNQLVKLVPILPQMALENNFRSPAVQSIYEAYSKHTPKDIRTQILLKELGESKTGLLYNHFYYDRLLKHLPYVRHLCYWYSDPNKEDKQIFNELNQIINGESKTFSYDFIFFTNLPQAKSIPEFPHTHIFVNYGFAIPKSEFFKPQLSQELYVRN